jgi:hypothetical protein
MVLLQMTNLSCPQYIQYVRSLPSIDGQRAIAHQNKQFQVFPLLYKMMPLSRSHIMEVSTHTLHCTSTNLNTTKTITSMLASISFPFHEPSILLLVRCASNLLCHKLVLLLFYYLLPAFCWFITPLTVALRPMLSFILVKLFFPTNTTPVNLSFNKRQFNADTLQKDDIKTNPDKPPVIFYKKRTVMVVNVIMSWVGYHITVDMIHIVEQQMVTVMVYLAMVT